MSNRKIKAMHREYGRLDGCKCGDCCNLSSYTQSRTWYKCEAYGNSNSEATDWAKRNIACGLFNISFDKVNRIPLIQKLKHEPKQIIDEPIKGQSVMELLK
jgi:hypothetical protein